MQLVLCWNLDSIAVSVLSLFFLILIQNQKQIQITIWWWDELACLLKPRTSQVLLRLVKTLADKGARSSWANGRPFKNHSTRGLFKKFFFACVFSQYFLIFFPIFPNIFCMRVFPICSWWAWYLNQGRPHLPRFRISRGATSCKCPRWTLFCGIQSEL